MSFRTYSIVYLLLFLPLIAAIFCQISSKKIFGQIITIGSALIMFFLSLFLFYYLISVEQISNDFGFELLSIGLEFNLNFLSLVFLGFLSFLNLIILLLFRREISSMENSSSKQNRFYGVFLLKMFGMNGILLSNHIFNLYFFIEIFCLAHFSQASLASSKNLLRSSFYDFCLSAASSLLIFMSFFTVYLVFNEDDLVKITENFTLLPADKHWFLLVSVVFLGFAIITKFFPFWQIATKAKIGYLNSNSHGIFRNILGQKIDSQDRNFLKKNSSEKLSEEEKSSGRNSLFRSSQEAKSLEKKSFWTGFWKKKTEEHSFDKSDFLTDFLFVDALFVRALLGVFLSLKLIFFFFGNGFLFEKYDFSSPLILFGFAMNAFCALKINKTNNLKLICAYLGFGNIALIFAASTLQSLEALESILFFLVNFVFLGFLLFLLASLGNRCFGDFSTNCLVKIKESGRLMKVSVWMMLILLISPPFSFQFFGYWLLAISCFKPDLSMILLLSILLSGYSHFYLGQKIIFKNNNKESQEENLREKLVLKSLSISTFEEKLCFISLIALILIGSYLCEPLKNTAEQLALFLLSYSI